MRYRYNPITGLMDMLESNIGENLIGNPGEAGFGVGFCPESKLPDNMIPLAGCYIPAHDDYGNYQYQDGSIMVWVPKFYYRIGHVSNPTYGTYGVNSIDIKGIDTYVSEADANADGYALHRAFIDGGATKDGFFIDKYICSKNAWGTGQIASSIKNGLPISTAATHNPIADLTACAGNFYYETIKAAHARDGVDGAENPDSIFHVVSRFQYSALAMLAMAHGQASSNTTNCAWYDAAYNYPKGCNNNALKDYDEVSNGAGSGDDLLYVTDGYPNCGKTGSGVPFAKSTHNGQNCGIADVNGLMYEISIGVTCIAPAAAAIEAMSQANPCQITWTAHGMVTDDYAMILAITQADWIGCKDKIWKITKIDDDNFTIAFDASGFGAAYDPGTDPGTVTKGTFYLAKEVTAMKDFDSGVAGATDHWGATGIAAMMDVFVPAFENVYSGNSFVQKFGSGGNQVLSEAISGANWLLTGLGLPKDKDGIDTTGTNLFGKDYYYQYISNELCLLSCGVWYRVSDAGVWSVSWGNHRTSSNDYVGFRAACYPE